MYFFIILTCLPLSIFAISCQYYPSSFNTTFLYYECLFENSTCCNGYIPVGVENACCKRYTYIKYTDYFDSYRWFIVAIILISTLVIFIPIIIKTKSVILMKYCKRNRRTQNGQILNGNLSQPNNSALPHYESFTLNGELPAYVPPKSRNPRSDDSKSDDICFELPPSYDMFVNQKTATVTVNDNTTAHVAPSTSISLPFVTFSTNTQTVAIQRQQDESAVTTPQLTTITTNETTNTQRNVSS